MKIVVIGASGRIGKKLLYTLRRDGIMVRAASPSSGVNTVTGEGLNDALQEATVVVDVSNSHSLDGSAALQFFEISWCNLLAAGKAAGVQRHIALSIVGTDGLQTIGYFRAKKVQEDLIKDSGIPYSILRSTQFLEFLPQIAEEGAEGDAVRLSTGLMQPVAAEDVAATVAELAIGAPAGRVELGGPEALGMDDWARRLFAATGDERTVVSDPHARYFGTELKGGELTPGDGARIGTVDFDAWFATQQQETAR